MFSLAVTKAILINFTSEKHRSADAVKIEIDMHMVAKDSSMCNVLMS